ncbi:MAG: 4-(cytidine 5'-diphospho)-2-C-methyl-D-erythritol kinase [Deltaproteobacteria bacterium]|nr:4-(cytidine 5'-diphospho)-2-C-methyl-D-erythritol kinase [Deltaproteobacteria bacterium]
MTERISLHAPAKVNLRLDVLGKRPDGYHEIRTWIYPTSLTDELHITKVNTAKITITSDHPDLPRGEGNLAHRAAALFLKEHALAGGVQIEIIKRIPVAAGLGGGSSDAAAVLKAINILWGADVPQEGLMEMGAKLGMDVPFFIVGKSAMMGGKGEQLITALPPLKLSMLLINPGHPLSTQQVYEQGKWGLTKKQGDNKILMPPQDPEKMGKFLHNDLEEPAQEFMPIIDIIKGKLLDVGARGVLMTGSGPTVFGLFGEEAEARRAAADLTMEDKWVSFVAHTLVDV